MKRLAFSCAGEGFGHIARIVALSESLKDRYELIYFVPESVQNFLFSHLGDVPYVTIPSFRFTLKNHRIDYMRTVKENFKHLVRFDKEKKRIKELLSEYKVDCLVCDFEPYVSRAAADMGIPLLNLNHPGIVLKTFSLSFSGVVSRIVASFMTPRAQETLFCSFFNGEVGPIIRKEIKEKKPVSEDFYVVYAKNDSREALQEALKEFEGVKFEFFPRKDGDFADALSRCKGVISPAGHQLLSEALFLRKPILAFPQKHQYEQKVNARMLEKSGYGIHGRHRRIKKDAERFFREIDNMPFKAHRYSRFKLTDDTAYIVDFISNFVETQTENSPTKLCRYTYLDTIHERISVISEAYANSMMA